MKLSAEDLLKNWDKHIKIVDSFIKEPRKSEVLHMLEELKETLIMAPASGRVHYHNAFPGGYIDHVNRVVEYSLRLKYLWEELNADVNFSEEELVFCALFHDLGKIGNGELVGYIPQKDKWRNEKIGEVFTHNPDLSFMLIQDRSLFLLQKFNIILSENEYLGIKLHDGLYDESNKPYFLSIQPESKLRTNLVHILHQADFMAAKVEYDKWRNTEPEKERKQVKSVPSSKGLLDLVKDL